MKTRTTTAVYINGKKIRNKNVVWGSSNLKDELEELEYHIYGSLAWSEKHDKEKMLSAIANNLTQIIDKYFPKGRYIKAL